MVVLPSAGSEDTAGAAAGGLAPGRFRVVHPQCDIANAVAVTVHVLRDRRIGLQRGGQQEPHTVLPQDVEKFRAALKFMNDTSVDLLGLRSFFFVLKVEKCFTMADLKELIPQFSRAIAKSKGAEVARAMEERVQRMIL